MTRCARASAALDEPLPGSAPRADAWVVVEHPEGWGDAPLARAEHGVRVLMARGPRPRPHPTGSPPGYRVWVADARPAPGTAGLPALRVGVVADPGQVAGWDLADDDALRRWGRVDPEPLLLVCANGRRDACCGHDGRRLADRLWAGPDRDRVLTCTHLGGHRFAPTALLLPVGLLHGRLDHDTARDLLPAARRGTTPSATLRGFSRLPEAAQVAEAHVRRATGYDSTQPLAVQVEGSAARAVARVGPVPGPDGTSAVREVPLVRSERLVLASCGRAPEPMARWSVAGPGPGAGS